MKYKTRLLADRFVAALSMWPSVECITVNEAAMQDTLDPYFALILDVFCSASIPGPQTRRGLYGDDVVSFETSPQGLKDRFLVGDIPLRLEYKSTIRVDELVDIAAGRAESLWLIKDSGTYGFYRLANGEVLFSRTTWLNVVRRRLKNLGDQFWEGMRGASQSKMEHFLNDLGAAYLQNDEFHYLLASAGFIKEACLTLFCVNRRFEPSHRSYYKQVMELPSLPDSFPADLENFLHQGPDMTMNRRYSLAQIIARSIVNL
ncbi:MAG: DUF4037 domain-containing protein [Treponema sp.]|jgi:hypothetical protein|nr:DUF4037 domain-containing protein [Treponema sp.]